MINLQLEDRVHYKFAVTKLSEDWTPIDHSFFDLDVALATGEISNIEWTSASEAELANAPDEPVYVPMMAQEQSHDVCK